MTDASELQAASTPALSTPVSPHKSASSAGSRWAGLQSSKSQHTAGSGDAKSSGAVDRSVNPLETAIQVVLLAKKKPATEDANNQGDAVRNSKEDEKNELYVELYQSFAAAFEGYVRCDQKETKLNEDALKVGKLRTPAMKVPGLLGLMSEFAADTATEKWEPMFRALGMLLVSRDHLLVVDQLQLGFLKGQWSVMCDGFFNAGSLAKNTTTLVVQLVLNSCHAVSLPIREAMTNTVGFLELFSALTVSKKTLDLRARLSLERWLALADDSFQMGETAALGSRLVTDLAFEI